MQAPDTVWVAFDHDGVMWGPARHRSSLDARFTPVEYALVSPSVRLARWLDADPEREAAAIEYPEGWRVTLSGVWLHDAKGPTRDEALSDALDQAEAGATTEGER